MLMSIGRLAAAIWLRWTIFWGTVKDECYANQPETIQELKHEIKVTIDEIRAHTVENVLKNWVDRMGYCAASHGSHLNEIVFHV